MSILLLVVVVSLFTGSSLVEGYGNHNNKASKAISKWQKANQKKIHSAINDISNSSEVPDLLTKLKTAFELDETASKSLKLVSGGGLFGSFERDTDDNNNDNDNDNDNEDDSGSSWL
jgi:hypothetical protein